MVIQFDTGIVQFDLSQEIINWIKTREPEFCSINGYSWSCMYANLKNWIPFHICFVLKSFSSNVGQGTKYYRNRPAAIEALYRACYEEYKKGWQL